MYNKIIEEYNEIQSFVGTILDCPGKGGNISVKNNDCIIVKSSGEDLKKKHVKSILKNNKIIGSIDKNDCFSEFQAKPSMEVLFHQVIPQKYVAHYHPVYVLPFLCSDSNLEMIDAKPGEELALKIKEYMNSRSCHSDSDGCILLKNHGVIIYSESILLLHRRYDIIKQKFLLKNENYYTPDDLVDTKSDELWLFRNTIENIANKLNLKLNNYEHTEILQDANEIFRQTKM